MVFRFLSKRGAMPDTISGDGINLRNPVMEDFAQWCQLRKESAGFLVPLEPQWPQDDLSAAGFRRRMRRIRRERDQGSGYTYFLFDPKENTLLGGLSVFNIRFGASQSATLGYWMGECHAGKGHMTRAVAAIIPLLFGQLGLKRLEAACLADNARSIRLLKRNGFRHEGTVRSYLEINGIRQDHELFALLAEDFELNKDQNPA